MLKRQAGTRFALYPKDLQNFLRVFLPKGKLMQDPIYEIDPRINSG